MNNYLQSLISAVVIVTGITTIFFYFFFGKVNDSNRQSYMSQDIEELKRTDFSKTTRILNYIYIALVIALLLIIYFLVPWQKLG